MRTGKVGKDRGLPDGHSRPLLRLLMGQGGETRVSAVVHLVVYPNCRERPASIASHPKLLI
jgi:hypothetical protein